MAAPTNKANDADDFAERATKRQAAMRRRTVRLVVFGIIAAVLAGGLAIVYPHTEQTRECTIESVSTPSERRNRDRLVLHTAECGDIAVREAGPIRVVDPDCYWNNFKLGGRYAMTTRGFDGWWVLYRPLSQRLVGPLVLVESPPGAVCSSDSWYIED
jgi:hypothetical protein